MSCTHLVDVAEHGRELHRPREVAGEREHHPATRSTAIKDHHVLARASSACL
jgi:hypothetical protein